MRLKMIKSFRTSLVLWLCLLIWWPFACQYAGHDFPVSQCSLWIPVGFMFTAPAVFLVYPLLYLAAHSLIIASKGKRHSTIVGIVTYPAFAFLLFMMLFTLSLQNVASGYYDKLNHGLWADVWPLVFTWLVYAITMEKDW